jgi:hypothetical protein
MHRAVEETIPLLIVPDEGSVSADIRSHAAETMHYLLRQCGALAHESQDNVAGMGSSGQTLTAVDHEILSLPPQDLAKH